MNNREINAALSALSESMYLLEEEYMENGGEVTETTESMEAQIEVIKALLEGEGIDSLGRWLKAKEDLIKTLKAEKASVDRQIKATENSIEYIKFQVYNVLSALGKEKVKGTFYSFAPSISRKTEVDKEMLKEKYMEEVSEALKEILPSWVSVNLTASVKAFNDNPEYGVIPMPSEFRVVETPTCKFVKPRAGREE